MKKVRILRHFGECSILLLLTLSAAELSGRATTVDALTPAGSMEMPFTLNLHSDTVPVWSNGAFVFVQYRFSGAPIIQIFDRRGTESSKFTFSIPRVSHINIYDNSVARGLDGSLALIGTVYGDDDPRGPMFIAWVSPDRQEQTIIRTSPFFPHTVTLASDGTIWVAGHDTKVRHEEWDLSQCLIRRYDKTGKLLGSFLSWASLGTDPPIFPPTVYSLLLPLKDGVGWYSPYSHTYIEFSSDGTVVKRLETAPHSKYNLTQVAICEDGGLFVSSSAFAGPQQQASWRIFALDRARGEWSSIPRNETWGILFGCDGERLATTTDFKTISWLEPTRNGPSAK